MLTVAIGLTLIGASGLQAQEQEPTTSASGEPMIEEVLVTAQKREQSLQDVPISITAFSRAEIERAGINEFADYATKAPNVGFGQQGNRSSTKVAIRGVTNIGGKANSVGIYEDEFNIAPNILVTGHSRTADTSLYDVERIEVLRGPQGTFFGRNTMGGAISITTRKPDPSGNFGSLKLEADDWGGYLGRLSYNLSIGESNAFLFTGYYRDVGDFIDNIGPSGASNEGDEKGFRVAFRAEPSDDLTIDISAAHSEFEQDMQSMIPSGELAAIPSDLVNVVNFWPFLWQPIPVPPIDTSQYPEWPLPVTDVPFYPDNYSVIATDLPYASTSDTDTYIMNISWDFRDDMTLTSVTGYIDNEFDLYGDGDYSIYPAFTVGRDSESEAWSQELRLSSFGNDRFDWMIGGIYSSDEITETDISTHLSTDPYLTAWGATLFALAAQDGLIDFTDPTIQYLLTNGLVPSVFGDMTLGNFEDVDRANDTDSWAVFGDVTWHLTDKLDAAFGLRYTDDSLTFSEVTRPTVILPVGTDVQKTSFTDWSPRFNLNWYATTDTMVYGTISKGYKVGGVNSDVTAALPEVEKFYGEETGWNYETGFKTAFANNRVQLNVSAFYFDWEDLQVRGQDVISQRQFVQNAADATSKGLEIELVAAVTSNQTLRAAYGRLDSTFGYFPNAVDLNGDVFDATGNAIPFSPDNTFSASYDIDIPLDMSFDAYLRFDYSYVDDQATDAANTPSRMLPSYQLFNVRAGIANERYDLSLWIKNAADEEYVLGNNNLETFYGGFMRAVGPPRQFGATFSLFF
jgi:iron complex outermembrane receptor protein